MGEGQGRRLGIDWGTKRVGVALSDALGLTARGLTCLTGGDERVISELAGLARQHEVVEVVVGLPRNMNATLGPQAARARAFAEALEKAVELPVQLWDERLSSAEAERHLKHAGLSRKKRKARLDQVAAALILQSYLDARS